MINEDEDAKQEILLDENSEKECHDQEGVEQEGLVDKRSKTDNDSPKKKRKIKKDKRTKHQKKSKKKKKEQKEKPKKSQKGKI